MDTDNVRDIHWYWETRSSWWWMERDHATMVLECHLCPSVHLYHPHIKKKVLTYSKSFVFLSTGEKLS